MLPLVYNITTLQHLQHLSESKEIISFDKLNNENISDHIEILQRFKYNMERRKEIKQNFTQWINIYIRRHLTIVLLSLSSFNFPAD